MKSRNLILVNTPTLVLLVGLLVLNACGGAVRLPVRSHGPAGANIVNPQINLHLLQSGTTQRSEVAEKLATIDSGSSNPRVFWGRWSESKWGYWWVVAGPGGGAAGDARRLWHVKNVLLTFDNKGVLQQQQVFNNDREFWTALGTELNHVPLLDLSEPVPLIMYAGHIQQISLARDGIDMEVLAHKKKLPLHISPAAVVRFSHNGTGDKSGHPAVTCHTLHLAEKTAAGKSIHMCGEASAVVTLFQYLHQMAPPSMRWE
jgi:hypothetical protein